MDLPINVECNKVIDQVIASRRSIRKFKMDSPSREVIEQILQAGLLAPYASASVSREDFRRFIVIPRESSATAQVAAIMKRKAESWSKQLETKMQTDEFAKQHAGPFLERLKLMGEHGMPNIGKAPYYIVVAEQRGIPPVEHLSLAHCLQNMWLKQIETRAAGPTSRWPTAHRRNEEIGHADRSPAQGVPARGRGAHGFL